MPHIEDKVLLLLANGALRLRVSPSCVRRLREDGGVHKMWQKERKARRRIVNEKRSAVDRRLLHRVGSAPSVHFLDGLAVEKVNKTVEVSSRSGGTD